MTAAEEIAIATQTLLRRGHDEPLTYFVGWRELARWLESWTDIDFNERAAMPEDLRHALAVARAINGGEQR